MVAARKKTKKGNPGCMGKMVRVALALSVAALVIVGVAALLLVSDYNRFQERPVLAEGESLTLVVPRGTSWRGVVTRTHEAGLVDNPYYLDFWGRQTGLAEQVRAGTFLLDGPLSLEELAEILRAGGSVDEIVVTFPEGLTIFHMADRLEEAGLAERQEFLELVRDPARFGIEYEGVETLEGYLYPDTYRFRQGVSAEQIISRLVRRWQEVTLPLLEEHGERIDELTDGYEMGVHEVVIMASLIERETGVTDERDMVSRVFYNRLDRNMMLQTDPTCVYGEETYREIPHPRFCRDPLNRYSTYVIRGLPPGPIANPGRASLEAAINPSQNPEHMDYLFFVSRRDGSGSHYFSRTYEEHRRAIRRFLIRD